MSTATNNLNSSASEVAPHPWFRDGDKQTHEPIEGKVSGKIPTWLNGHLIRNGPGIQTVGTSRYNHLFDGLAILHKFTVKDGKAYYQSRALESEAYRRNFEAQRIVVNEYGTLAYPDPCQTIFGRLQATFSALLGKSPKNDMEMTDNCSVNVAFYGDQLYAMTETVNIRRVDPETLKSIGDKTRIRDHCYLNSATAHPHCLEDGSIINVGNNFRRKQGAHYSFVKIPPAPEGSQETAYKNAKMIAAIPSRWKTNTAYFHSFGMTSDKLIFVEQPLCFNLLKAVSSSITSSTIFDCMTWFPNEKSRFYVANMEDGKNHPIVYDTDELFTFHHINAYEENGCLIVDIAGYKNADFIKNVTIQALEANKIDSVLGATPRRYILPLNIEGAKVGDDLLSKSGLDFSTTPNAKAVLKSEGKEGTAAVVDITPHHFMDEWLELPRINYEHNGNKYNFFYGLGSSEKLNPTVPIIDKVLKKDIAKGTTWEFTVEKGDFVSEPVFVADPTKTEEDDGILLMSIIHKNDPKDVTLLILDAKDLKEVSRTKFHADGVVTGTFHGIWTTQTQN